MSRPPLTIRHFQAEDVGELYEIDRICFPEDIAFSRKELDLYLGHPQSITRLAEGSGRILGFAVARVDNRARAHIITLDVVPEARRQKIGTALLNALHEELKRRKVRVSFLEVGIHNLAAQRLYQGLQYRRLGTLPGYYHGREDAYRMGRFIARVSRKAS